MRMTCRNRLSTATLLLASIWLIAACGSSTTRVDAAIADVGLPDVLDATAHDSALGDGPASDTSTRDGLATDTLAQDVAVSDLGASFATSVAGIWLIGWSGGMNHYSWVRFTPTSASSGDAEINDGAALAINGPFWPCNGKGSYDLVAQPRSIQLHFPSSLCNGMKSSVLTFSSFTAASGYPPGALDSASVTISSSAGSPVEAYRFPSTQCDASMTTCTDPFQ